MTQPIPVPKSAYVGLFLTALATLMFEILLTRIFSATTWYHFAFMAISVAMFGMTVGALRVYLKPDSFTPERAPREMATAALVFACAIPLSFLAQLCIPIHSADTVVGKASFALIYIVVSVPFYFSGVAVCIALTKFPSRVSSLYGVDLAGAGLGCIALLYTLEFADGPTTVLIVATVAASGALFFSVGATGAWGLRVVAFLLAAGLSWSSVTHHSLVAERLQMIDQSEARDELDRQRIRALWAKGEPERIHDFERWNSYSRITVTKVEDLRPSVPFGWGMSAEWPKDTLLPQYGLHIDGAAGTVMSAFDGADTRPLRHLKWDVTNVAHYLRQDAEVLVVGVGGGRDILSALVFDQEHVTGVELNKLIFEILTENETFSEFSGHLDQHPKVTLVHDEARSYIARTDARYDLLQISLIDTWAATSAGAFVLAENALYTMEGWEVFLDHLNENGLLTVSRWAIGFPAELCRSVALAAAALKARGVENPSAHMAVVRAPLVANLVVGRDPLSDQDLATLRAESERMGFDLVLSGDESTDPVLAALSRGELPGDGGEREVGGTSSESSPLQGLALDLSPPTDNRPFFFNMLPLENVLYDLTDGGTGALFGGQELGQLRESMDFNVRAVRILGVLLVVVVVLTMLCVFLPLLFTIRRVPIKRGLPLLFFFAAIGFGFMLVELSQMHRLILFLGHPTYGLSVVLFALLLSSGTGSLLSQRFEDAGRVGPRVILALLGVLVAFGVVTPLIAVGLESAATPMRIGIALVLLFPIGLLMGMLFPLGMRLAAHRTEQLTPWLWGVNGATSVCASVLSTGIAMAASISTAFWIGVGCYVVALAAFMVARVVAGRGGAGAMPVAVS